MSNNEKLTWKRGIFKCAFQLFSGQEQVGKLTPSWKTMSASGQINDNNYHFKTSEWKGQSLILNKDNQEVIGRIKFSKWMHKATIELGGEVYRWKFSNLWESKWKIISKDETLQFSGHTCKGSMDYVATQEVLALAGLFIGNYFWNMAAIYAAVIIPLFAAGGL